MKFCPICKKLKDNSDFHKNKVRIDGLSSYCKSCASEKSRLWYKNNTERATIRGRKYYQQHKTELIEQQREYKQKPSVKARIKVWRDKSRQKPETKKKRVIESIKYNQNPEVKKRLKEYRKKNKNKLKQYRKEYYQKNKIELNAKQLIRSRRYFLKKKDITELFTNRAWIQKVTYFNGMCPSCNLPFEQNGGMTLDHNPPISIVPRNHVYTLSDVIPLCSKCNSSKNAKVGWFENGTLTYEETIKI